MLLIGIHGRAGSGKDTVGEILKDDHDFATTSFAFPIKQMVAVMLGVDIDKLEDREWREESLGGAYGERSPRHLMQTLGTEWGRRHVDQNIWVELALERVAEEFPRVAITDVRFDNEAGRIRGLGGYVIHVHRSKSDLQERHAGHSSEHGLTAPHKSDIHINNYGTLEDLKDQVNAAIAAILQAEEEKAVEEVQGDSVDTAGTGD